MSAPSAAPRSGRTTRLSQFTNLDLQLLAQSSPESPLRVVALVDCDAFYAQCETIRLGIPTSRPLAVRQWNAIIALNHPARKNNLKRGMSVDEVRQLCPGIKLPLPTITGLRDWEPDTTVAFSDGEFPERELDWDDVVLLIGAGIVRSIRKEMRKQLQLTTSAGVSHNKMLAKMASRINKPNQQTITGRRSAPALLYNSNISDLPRLGGQLGLKVSLCFASDKISDILRDPLAAMAERLGTEHAQWVYDAIRGREKSPVVARSQVQSLLSAKTFVPFLTGLHQAKRWLRIFAADLEARLRDLEADSVFPRRPGTIAVHHRIRGRFGPTRSKQASIPRGVVINQDLLLDMSYELLGKLTEQGPSWPCMGISIGLSNLEASIPEEGRITSFFVPGNAESSQKRCRDHNESPMATPHKKQHLLPKSDGHTLQQSRSTTTKTESVPPGTSSFLQPASNYLCPICGESVGHEVVLEHLDWHVALDIQTQQ